MSEAITFKAQLSPLQSAMQHGPDGMLVKLIPQNIDEALAGELFRLQQCALRLTIRDVMGDFTVDASIPDTASAVRINKTSPQVSFHIPRGDVLIGLRLVALFGVVFTVEITGGAAKVKPEKVKREKKPPKPGTDANGLYWAEMKRAGWDNVPGVEEALAFDDDSLAWYDHEKYMAEGIRRTMNVTSRREITPAALEGWAITLGLDSLITVSRGAQAAALRHKPKAEAQE